MVGNGESISFWNNNWVFNYPIKQKCVPVDGTEEFKVSYFITNSGQQNRELLFQYIPSNVVIDILKVFIPSNSLEDKVFWSLPADGEYSIKSGVAFLQGYGLNSTTQ